MQLRFPLKLRDALEQKFRPDWHSRFGQRTTGIVVAVGIELLLVILLLTLGRSEAEPSAPVISISTFDTAEEPSQAEEEEPEEEQQNPDPSNDAPAPETPPEEAEPIVTEAPAPVTPLPDLPAPALIPLTRDDLARADITPKTPSTPARPARSYGPSNSRRSGAPDSERVGTAPNGQPMYAARWFREPRDDELAGYLSTASGPGWGLIACQTAPNYRVEKCEIIAESPVGSDIARSAKAAAWQFQVRPPRIGGVSQVGEWVRIRIDYTNRPR